MSINQKRSEGFLKRILRELSSYQVFALSFFLLLGGVLAGVASLYNPQKGMLKTNIKFIEYRKLKVAEQAVIKREKVIDYSRITILMKTSVPENSKTAAVVYGIRNDGSINEIQRIEDISSSWISWEQQISYSDIEIIIKPSLQTNSTTQDLIPQPNSNIASQNQNNTQGNLALPEQPVNQSEQISPLQTEVDLLIYLQPK